MRVLGLYGNAPPQRQGFMCLLYVISIRFGGPKLPGFTMWYYVGDLLQRLAGASYLGTNRQIRENGSSLMQRKQFADAAKIIP